MKATRKKEASSETQYVPNTCDACSDGAAKLVVAINLLRIEQDRRHDDLPDGGYGLSEAERILHDIRKELLAAVAQDEKRRASDTQ